MREIIYDDVVKNIRKSILEKGMKQTVVAERAGFRDSDFSNMLNGRKLVRVEHIPRIAKALGVELQDLFQLSDEKEVSG